ncbi:12816_t:CDS:2 [Cetraspora pellucida]|uniref:12816_t:CDS:1 n=1 Tax=Cetraspora pellucida TaxID=1433469 RepID=A0ACA9LU58_9GLOM|nr:12816_t:CDS:2 [Cetraspora pellucida]
MYQSNMHVVQTKDYEENELVLDTIHDLKSFFQNSNNCTCRTKQKDLRTCFKKVGPAYLKLCGINDYLLSTLQNHLQSNGLTECVHGNSRRASKTESRHQDNSEPRASDLCEVCTSFKAKLLVTKQNVDEYNKVQAEYNEHKEAADLERKHYNNNIE